MHLVYDYPPSPSWNLYFPPALQCVDIGAFIVMAYYFSLAHSGGGAEDVPWVAKYQPKTVVSFTMIA